VAGLIEVLDGGLGVTLQDGGRPGYRRYGIALSGALDPVWLACANALVGNPPGAAALELRLSGPRLRVASGRVRVALAGAADIAVSGRPTFSPWQSLTLEEGEELRVGTVRGGIAYLAVAGGIDTPPLLGSRATHLRAGLGGVAGRALAAGDRLPVGEGEIEGGERRQSAFAHEDGPIRLLPGPQDDHFTPPARRALVEQAFAVSRDADRMGLRLEGPPLAHEDRFGDEIPASRRAAPRDAGAPSGGSEATRAWGSFVSDGVAPGALQVPPPTASRSCCWPTARPSAAIRRSPRRSAPTCRASPTCCRGRGCASPMSAAKRPPPRCARSRRGSPPGSRGLRPACRPAAWTRRRCTRPT
jgi:biotin-dependent carboxylase-like uncharacterized protein